MRHLTFSLFVMFLLFMSTFINAQQTSKSFDYATSWKKVEDFSDKSLPESALKVVNEIYAHAQKDNNADQLIKALIHIIKFTQYKEEDEYVKNINRLETELKTAKFPAKPMLHSMLAEVYWNYYENNRYKFNDRTKTADFKNNDISTWSLEKIVEDVISNYMLSVKDGDALKQIKTDYFKEIIVKGNEKGSAYRPTLFDFLAQRAIDFFMNSEPDIIKPAYAFTINNADYLKDAGDFVNLNIATRDTLAYKYFALKLFQDVIRFHLNDSKPEALLDADMKRLAFVYQNLTVTNKEDLYLSVLQKLEQKHITSPISTLISYEIAQIWGSRGEKYNPLQTDDHKWDKKKAYDICQSAIDRFPNSEGAAMAYNYQQQLLFKNISATIEKINVPGMPFRAYVKYKNFANLSWKIVKVTRKEVRAERLKWQKKGNVDKEQKFLEYFLAKAPVAKSSVALPDDKDLHQHSTEVKINELPVGDYMIIFSASPEFNLSKNGLAYAFTTISDISYLLRGTSDGSTPVIVLNRSTGEPLEGATALVIYNVYNQKQSRYELVAGDKFLSNAQGIVNIPSQGYKFDKERYATNLFLDITWKNDSISTREIDGYPYENSGQIWQRTQPKPQSLTHTVFFLDRAIYRPGQTLYFKGLVYQTDGKNPQIQPNRVFTVTFYDVNSQVVATKEVTTNEYGTFNGTFTTPSAGLTGDMRLSINDTHQSSVSFSVEEYKRPKFEVSFEPVKGSYRLNDSVNVTGKAIAYSGANIDGASVAYRIVRRVNFPFWWWCRYGYYPSSPEMEITSGTAKTDAEGKFTVSFTAIPDESVDRKSDPTFDYAITADVTDINGETHSSETTVGVGYKSLKVGVSVKDIDQSNANAATQKLVISTTNLSGTFEEATVNIKINRLQNPARTFRERQWERPDKQTLPRNEYYKSFPYDLYDDENNSLKWPADKEVLNKTFNTATEKDFTLNDIATWKPGKYKLDISGTDKFGEKVQEVAYFTVNNSTASNLEVPEINLFAPLNTTCEPGEKATLLAGSSEKISVLYEIERDGSILESKRLDINNKKQVLEIPIKEEYRGNIAVHYSFVKNNRSYTSTQVINVPYTNKQLDIQFETFRNKLQPGEQEQWKLRIKGKTADKALAEMVATLYDASLDEFRANGWYANFYNSFYSRLNWSNQYNFGNEPFNIRDDNWNDYTSKNVYGPRYAYLNWFGCNFYTSSNDIVLYESMAFEEVNEEPEIMRQGTTNANNKRKLTPPPPPPPGVSKFKTLSFSEIVFADAEDIATVEDKVGISITKDKSPKQDLTDVKIRKNFNETAFFFPNLQTNENGEIIVNFTIPEALTRWNMLGFAHTKELASGSITNQLVTQKDLMVVPNAPRFFRENDKMTFAVKVTSLSETDLTGEATLEFFDALTMNPVNILAKQVKSLQPFAVKPKQSTNLEWKIEIPEGVQAISYRVKAKAGTFSDGEEMTLPVVTNRMLVTETLPLPIRGKQTKTFTLDKLLNNTSSTLKNQRYTLEFTANPAWYAIQALPYLMEYPYECTEQTFSRFYANAIASHIANSNPRIKQVFDTWAKLQPDALLSNLEKNQELKTALLEETPWVLNAKSENERKRNVALLFDLNRMANELERAMKKIKDAQSGNGGFSWFPGLPEDIYMTQHIVSGLGHLDVMGVKSIRTENSTWEMTQQAVAYMDVQMNDRYEYLKREAKKGNIKLIDNHLGYTDVHYLYGRSFFKDVELPSLYREAFDYYLGQAKKYWTKNSLYMQGMIALALHRNADKATPAAIIASLRERSLNSEEMGMYWKFDNGYYWYQAPIETQALLIEAFDEITGDTKTVDDLKTWLLKQKQTQDWKTTKATTEACYALLRRGSDVLTTDNQIEIKVGNEMIDPAKRPDIKTEAGTGYFKTAWTASEITPKMGKIEITKKNDGVAWGAVYWQYFEQLDKITPAETPLKLNKQLFLQQNTDRGPVITPITDQTQLKPGDLVKVRIELRVDRAMEYVHLKDMRAAAFEPVQTLSTFKYQDGLWYYESPRDLATNFFIGWLPKGTYVFEYPLRVSQKGDFSNGVTTIQCMYAPEFSSHSEGVRVKID